MPQLDKVTFFSQFFWLCFFYLAFYFVILKYFLPEMSRILKFRKKKISQSQQGVNSMQEENKKIRDSKDALLEDGVNISKKIFKDSLQQTTEWLGRNLENTNRKALQDTNKAYVSSLGERALSQDLSLLGGSVNLSERLYALLLVDKLQKERSSPQGGEAASRKGKKGETNKEISPEPSSVKKGRRG